MNRKLVIQAAKGSARIEIAPNEISALKQRIADYEREISTGSIEDCRKILDSRRVGARIYWLNSNNIVSVGSFAIDQSGEFPSEKRPRQLVALSDLMQVADALNGEDAYNGRERFHFVVVNGQVLHIRKASPEHQSSPVYFKSVDIGQKALEILGIDCIVEAIGQ